ncbi:hypothetical protein UFOVP78_14 [uncultured Caudovirales phage]|uniref:Uncharacterized protein n=1 Tax=uncultured Caudovirales phage TaxID=2100421 RepID=A0A6J5KW50_9CAUD|nr:hypothetical protein UFOVP78_14 [uncultured Caudovirales phage]
MPNTPDHRYNACTILSGASILTDGIDIHGTNLVGIIAPAAWTAAALTFQVSADNVAFYDLYDTAGAEVSIVVTAGKYLALPAAALSGLDYIKLRSGTAGAPVNQAADRAFTLISKRYR